MINETFGRSIITVLKSSKDVINFGVLYIPLGRMSFNIIKIWPIVLKCKGLYLLGFFEGGFFGVPVKMKFF